MTSPMPETMSPREKVARTITYNPVYGKLWEGSDPTKGHIYHLASSGDHAELADTLASPFNACCYREKCQTLIAEVAALRETNTEAERKLADERLNYEGAMSDIDSLLKVLIRRINGEADLASAAEWVRLNYPIAAEAIISKEAERG